MQNVFKRLDLSCMIGAVALAAALLPSTVRAANVMVLSASLSDPAPCPGQMVTVHLQVRNNSTSISSIGKLVGALEAVATHPTCMPYVTATEADKWWVISSASTPGTPITPVQANPLTAGYDLSMLANETRNVDLAIQIPTALAYGSAWRLHLETDDYFVSAGSSNPLYCVNFSACTPSYSASSLRGSVDGTATNGSLEVLWLDYDDFNNVGNQVRVTLPPCFTVLSASPQPYNGSAATLVGQTVTWRVADANAASPTPYEAKGRLFVQVSLAGCSGTLAWTGEGSPDGSTWTPANTVSQTLGTANAVLAKQQLNAANLPSTTLNNGDTVKYVLQYQVSGSGLACFDSANNLALGDYSGVAGAAAFGSWSYDAEAGSPVWRVADQGSGERAIQFRQVSTYHNLLYSCPAAATNGEDICGSIMVEADVRIDGNAANGDTGIVLRDNGKVTGAGHSAYLALLSVDPNPSGNLMLQRTLDGSVTWPVGGAYTAPAGSSPLQGIWYTVKALEQPVGSFHLKYWMRGTPEPTGWQVAYTDPTPFSCGTAGDGIVWKPGLAGLADLMSYDNFRVFAPGSATGLQVWDTVPAGIDFQSSQPTANGSTPVCCGINEGLVRWDFTGSNFGATGGVVYDASGSFTWTGIVDCAETAGPVFNTASVKHSAMGAPASSNTTSLSIVCGSTATATPSPGAGTATPSCTVTGTLTLTATPTPTPSASPTTTPSQTATATTTPTVVSNIGLVKSVFGTPGPTYFSAIGYSIAWNYQNLAPLTANLLEIVDTLPTGFQYVSAAAVSGPVPSYITYTGGILTVRYTGAPAVSAGDAGIIQVYGQAWGLSMGKTFYNVASASTDGPWATTFSNQAAIRMATATGTSTCTTVPSPSMTMTPTLVMGTSTPSLTTTMMPTVVATSTVCACTASSTSTHSPSPTPSVTPSPTPTATPSPTPVLGTSTATPTVDLTPGCVTHLNTWQGFTDPSYAYQYGYFGATPNHPATLDGLTYVGEGATVTLLNGQNGVWLSEYTTGFAPFNQVKVNITWRALTAGATLRFNYRDTISTTGYTPYLVLTPTLVGAYQTDVVVLPSAGYFPATLTYYAEAAGGTVELDAISFDMRASVCYTVTHFPTDTSTPTPTSAIGTATPTFTATPSNMPTIGDSPTVTPTYSTTPSRTLTSVGVSTFTQTCSPTPSTTPTGVTTYSMTPTRTLTPASIATFTQTCSPTPSTTPAGFTTFSMTATRTLTPASIATLTITPTPTPGGSTCVAALIPGCVYPAVWIPVCGCNGITYSNSSAAACNGITVYTLGACAPTPTPTPVSPGFGKTWPYPVPAKGLVNFAVTLPAPASLRAEVLNSRGRLVTVLTGHLDAGTGKLVLDLTGFAPGIYHYLLKITYDDGSVQTLRPRSFAVRR